jgi:hypothetical protein
MKTKKTNSNISTMLCAGCGKIIKMESLCVNCKKIIENQGTSWVRSSLKKTTEPE